LHEAKEALRIKLPADKNAALRLNPGEEPFDQPASGISRKVALLSFLEQTSDLRVSDLAASAQPRSGCSVFSSFFFWNELTSCGVHSRPLHHHEAACNVRTNLIGAALRACRAALFLRPSTPFRESVERVTSKNQAFSKS